MAEERIQRRLTTILAADVVGFSRLMREDEETTLEGPPKRAPTIADEDVDFDLLDLLE